MMSKYGWGKNPNSRNGFKKGYKPSPETISKLKKVLGGIKKRPMSEARKKQNSELNKGRHAKEKHPNWKGGVTPLRKILYCSIEYKLWRKAVFERDNYTCIWCGKRGVELNADHIKPWCDYPELRFAIDNGRTLCEECHRKTSTWGVHKKVQE